MRSQAEIVMLLIKMGANINLLDSKGETALFYGNLKRRLSVDFLFKILFFLAVSDYESNDTLMILIDEGLTVNHQNIDGKTPLMAGIKMNNQKYST